MVCFVLFFHAPQCRWFTPRGRTARIGSVVRYRLIKAFPFFQTHSHGLRPGPGAGFPRACRPFGEVPIGSDYYFEQWPSPGCRAKSTTFQLQVTGSGFALWATAPLHRFCRWCCCTGLFLCPKTSADGFTGVSPEPFPWLTREPPNVQKASGDGSGVREKSHNQSKP